MKKKTFQRFTACLLSLLMVFSCIQPFAVGAAEGDNIGTFNGNPIAYSDFVSVGSGTWKLTDGVISADELTDWNFLQFNKDLGDYYTIEFDVKQDALNDGWQQTDFAIEVNSGENFTQSGYTLDLHNAGVGRVIMKNGAGVDGVGTYDTALGGTLGYTPSTNWVHIKITRGDGNAYTFAYNDGTDHTITFTNTLMDGGYLTLGSIGSRRVSYRNFVISNVKPQPIGTFNGTEIPYSDFVSVGSGSWKNDNGVIIADELTDWNFLQYNQDLGDYYTIEFDVKQDALNDGWQQTDFAIEVNSGENFTQSGYTLDLHNAGVGRVIMKNGAGVDGVGTYDTALGGTLGYTPSTNWVHIKITRDEASNFTFTYNDGTNHTISFVNDLMEGGYFTLGAIGSRRVSYKNIVISTVKPLPPTVGTFNGTDIPYTDFVSVGSGSWKVSTDGVISADELTDWNFLQYNKNLGDDYYSIEFDVKQDDVSEGWQQIDFAVEVNQGENFTQSGYTLDLHNAGVGRVIMKNGAGVDGVGTYDTALGGTIGYTPSTDWVHVKITRIANNAYTFEYNDGTEHTINFTNDLMDGGYLTLGAIGSRHVHYKNIVISTVKPVENPVGTFNGEQIPYADFVSVGSGSWKVTDGVISADELTDWNFLQYNKDLGSVYTVEFDVKQDDVNEGWQQIDFAVEVNSGENFTQGGYALDLHNAGVGRVIMKNGGGVDGVGTYDTALGGTLGYTPSTDWVHVKITRIAGSAYTFEYNDGTAHTINFTNDLMDGGYLTLGAIGSRHVHYKNFVITTGEPEPPKEEAVGRFNGSKIKLSTDFANAGSGSWKVDENGVLSADELTEWNLLRFNTQLAPYYDIEFDVKQEALNDGWQTTQFGFEVNAGENYTQSGYTVELHNAGVARVIVKNAAGVDGVGTYDTPLGGNGAYTPTTEWMHVRITRLANNKFRVIYNDGTEHTLTFTSAAFNGGYLVLGSVGNRRISYKNIVIKTYDEPEVEPTQPDNTTYFGTMNGKKIPYDQWTNCAFGSWNLTNGVIHPAEKTDFTLLRLEKDLGKHYTVEFDVKQPTTGDGWNTINIGFNVKSGENFTQSGYTLDMHNAGVLRVVDYPNANRGASFFGSYDNPFDQNWEYTKTTGWIHIKIERNNTKYTITISDGATKVLTFTDGSQTGGYLVLGAVGKRDIYYKNVKITTGGSNASKKEKVGTINGAALYFDDFTWTGSGTWKYNAGVMEIDEQTEYNMIRLDKYLGTHYSAEFDVQQEDTTSGWQTMQIGFNVKKNENFTQSGYTLDLHNAGVGRVIIWPKQNAGPGTRGSYDNTLGDQLSFNCTTDWVHVKFERNGDDYTVTYNDGTEHVITFNDNSQQGGYLCLGSVGNRNIKYKNVVIKYTKEEEPVEVRERAVLSETEAGGDCTYNGEVIQWEEWTQLGNTEWDCINGIFSPIEIDEFTFLQYNRNLGTTYTIEYDVKQKEVSTGWNVIHTAFDVNEGENYTQSGLTLDLHNAGVWRVINWKEANNADFGVGNYNNPFGGTLSYTCSTDWIHVRITREDNMYNIFVDDGNPQTSHFETSDYNGGYFTLGSCGNRDIMYRNIRILNYVENEVGELVYPEEVGSLTYTYDDNKYGEWIPVDPANWTLANGSMTSNKTDAEQTVYLDSEPIRNFRMEFDYEVLSEQLGTFGVSFRKKRTDGSYQGLGYSLIFNMTEDGKCKMTFADYTANKAAGLDAKVHSFELAGKVVLEASGNEFHVWLDDELIISQRDNSYAFGYISLFTQGCSVAFSHMTITSDYLTTDAAKAVAEAVEKGEITAETVAAYNELSDFQKSLLGDAVREAIEAFKPGPSKALVYGLAGGGAALAALILILILAGKKKKKKEEK